jgi:hypothetical protein
MVAKMARTPKAERTGATAPEAAREIAEGVRLEARRGRVVLSGVGVTDALRRDLEAWLRSRTADVKH